MIKHVFGYGVLVLLVLWCGWNAHESQQQLSAIQQKLTTVASIPPKLLGGGANGTSFDIELYEKHVKKPQAGDHELTDRVADYYADDLSLVNTFTWTADIDFDIVFKDKGLCKEGDTISSVSKTATCTLKKNLLSGNTKRLFQYDIQDYKGIHGPRIIKPCDGCLVELDQ